MAEFKDFYFPSCDGKSSIRARECRPEGTPKAVVQIAHGIAEHIERYDDFAAFLASKGFLVVGNDHLGHGKSFKTAEDKGFFTEKDGWMTVVSDLKKLHDTVAAENPGIPYVFFGHSMGSFLARTYLIKYPKDLSAAVISGTGHQGKALVIAGETMGNLLSRFKGARSDGQALNDIAFGAYCAKIENPRTAFDWLSRKEENVDKYMADENCGFVCKTGLYRDMMSGIKFITNQKNIELMNKATPVYFMSGDADPVGDYGKGVEAAYKAFCKAGMQDVTIRLYPGGRHEMLNEINNEQVYADILDWIESKI